MIEAPTGNWYVFAFAQGVDYCGTGYRWDAFGESAGAEF
jgi:hypothetical protein